MRPPNQPKSNMKKQMESWVFFSGLPIRLLGFSEKWILDSFRNPSTPSASMLLYSCIFIIFCDFSFCFRCGQDMAMVVSLSGSFKAERDDSLIWNTDESISLNESAPFKASEQSSHHYSFVFAARIALFRLSIIARFLFDIHFCLSGNWVGCWGIQ